jgi:hypothetical protein
MFREGLTVESLWPQYLLVAVHHGTAVVHSYPDSGAGVGLGVYVPQGRA